VLLAVSGLLFWFVVGLPWAPHNESFDWIVRLEQRSLWAALFERFPSVLSLRPLGTGPAWWGGLVLAAGSLSALGGVLYALTTPSICVVPEPSTVSAALGLAPSVQSLIEQNWWMTCAFHNGAQDYLIAIVERKDTSVKGPVVRVA